MAYKKNVKLEQSQQAMSPVEDAKEAPVSPAPDDKHDDKEKLVNVELNATHPNESVGKHLVNTGNGYIVFNEGKATVSESMAKVLKETLVIK